MILSGFFTAIRTLTSIPLPGKDAASLSASLPFFPLVGAFIGLASYGIAWVVAAFAPELHLVAAVIMTIFAIMITGCLHVDGLGDVADAFGGGKTKERILEILKDSRHGTYGVLAIVFDVAARIAMIDFCISKQFLILIAFSPIISRACMAIGCAFYSYARSGSGTAAPFVTAKYRLMVVIMLLCCAGCCMLLFPVKLFAGILLVSSLVVALLFYFFCRAKIGGITGDCLGAASELSELTFLLAGVILV